MDFNSAWNLFKISHFWTFCVWHQSRHFQSNPHRKGYLKISVSVQLPPCDSSNNKISKISESAHPISPLDSPEIQAIINNPRFPGINTLQELSHSLKLTLDIHTVNIWTLGKSSISFQLPPPGSSTKLASASSQAAAPHQPASSKASSQSAVKSTTLPHPHHGSQVC